MPQSTEQPQTLQYATPDHAPALGDRASVLTGILIVNSLAAIASLFVLPTIIHIFGCRASEKWCHLGAFAIGVPGAIILFILLMIALALTSSGKESRFRPLRFIGRVVLGLPALVIAALFIAVLVNSA